MEDAAGGGTDARVHELMDKMDDLGFAPAQVDGVADALQAQGDAKAVWDEQALLGRIFAQLLGDLAAFLHGQLRAPQGDLQAEIFAALQSEGFPFVSMLTAGPAALLGSFEGRVLALDFLLSQTQAARMLAQVRTNQCLQQAAQAAAASKATTTSKKRGIAGESEPVSESAKRARGTEHSLDAVAVASGSDSMEDVQGDASDDARELADELRLLSHTLQLRLPSGSDAGNGAVALRHLRTGLEGWLSASPLRPAAVCLPPLFTLSSFSGLQLSVLRDIYATFSSDYTLRVSVLRKRLEVTLQSFMWGGKGASAADDLTRLATSKLATFPKRANVDWYELWAATPAVLHIARLTSREYAQRSAIKRVIIGQVPDRGGRVDQSSRLQPDYDMPAFTARREGGHGGGHGGGGGGGHRGGGGGGGGRGGGGGGGGHHGGGGRGGSRGGGTGRHK